MAEVLDITDQVCPLTLVRAKLRVERMMPGSMLEIRLNAGEPLENLPRALAELGYIVSAPEPEDPAAPGGVHRIRVEKR